METETADKGQGIRGMVIGAFVGVMALLAYLFVGARNETVDTQKLLTAKVEEFAATQTKLDSISRVLDSKILEVRRLGGNVGKLERIKWQLETDKKRLKYDLNFSQQRYNLKINDYKTVLAQNETYIRQLGEDNRSLLSRTRALEQEKQAILSENEGLKSDKEALTQTVVAYSIQNSDLRQKVALASALKTVNLTVAAVQPNGKVRREGPFRTSRINQLLISFVVLANPVAAKGDRTLYARILDNNGAVLSESGFGGVIWHDERQIGYSFRQTVPYENTDQKVDMNVRWLPTYKPGSYTVEIYADGYRIGQGQFAVR